MPLSDTTTKKAKTTEAQRSIRFKTKLLKIGTWIILRLPMASSRKLPSRGMTLVKGTINGVPILTPLEPDGKGSHWLHVTKKMMDEIHADIGDTVRITIEPTNDWPEPNVPDDLKEALAKSIQRKEQWMDITPSARWDWIRWIVSTNNPNTRKHRIEVTFSKLSDGKRRPCCFNRSACCEPSVSKGGVLLEPSQV